MIQRRHVLGTLAGGAATALSGCGLLQSGPDPSVVEHVRGDVVVTGTEQVFDLSDGDGRVRATVENGGYDALVDLRLYWVLELGADPTEKTHEELLDAGYEYVERTHFDLPTGASRTHTFDATYRSGIAGHYVRKRNMTYGAIVENGGEAGSVTVELLDTSERGNPKTLATKTVEMDAGERRPILFEYYGTFDVFRVEVASGGG